MKGRFYARYVVGPQTIEGMYEVVDGKAHAVISEPMPWLDAKRDADDRNTAFEREREDMVAQ